MQVSASPSPRWGWKSICKSTSVQVHVSAGQGPFRSRSVQVNAGQRYGRSLSMWVHPTACPSPCRPCQCHVTGSPCKSRSFQVHANAVHVSWARSLQIQVSACQCISWSVQVRVSAGHCQRKSKGCARLWTIRLGPTGLFKLGQHDLRHIRLGPNRQRPVGAFST